MDQVFDVAGNTQILSQELQEYRTGAVMEQWSGGVVRLSGWVIRLPPSDEGFLRPTSMTP